MFVVEDWILFIHTTNQESLSEIDETETTQFDTTTTTTTAKGDLFACLLRS